MFLPIKKERHMSLAMTQGYRKRRALNRVLSGVLGAVAVVCIVAVMGLFVMMRYAEKPVAHIFYDEVGKPHCVAVLVPKEDRFFDCSQDWRAHRWQEVGPNWRVPRR